MGIMRPLDGVNTTILPADGPVCRSILRPLRLTKTTVLPSKNGENHGSPKNRLPLCFLIQPTDLWVNKYGQPPKIQRAADWKIMHGLQVNRDFIEKQHGRMNLLQPIIPIVRQRNGYVKDLKTCFLKKHRVFGGGDCRCPNGQGNTIVI